MIELVSPSFQNLAWLPVALLIFLLPGWSLARLLPTSTPLLIAFLASSVILFELVLGINGLGLPLHTGTVSLGLAAVTAALVWRKPVGGGGSPSFVPTSVVPELKKNPWLWLIPAVLALTSISVRAWIDPLSGYDNGTRWDYLARLFLAHQSLSGYPPISTTDFEFYSWCDGIPPLVPLLNFWIYAVTGSVAPALTALRVIGEALLLGHIVYRFSQLLWGKGAGWPAVAALSSSALAIWSVAMGQETGLTALSLVSMLYFLELHARDPAKVLIFWAAIAAAMGAVTREYGLSFPLLGLAVLIVRKQQRGQVFLFGAVSIGLAAPWYLRNWVMTGNPLYPQTLGGLLPGNAVHDEVMRNVAHAWRLRWGWPTMAFFGKLLLVLAGPLLALGLFNGIRGVSSKRTIWVGILLTISLWLWSVPQTAGGWGYSVRVLSPALALCAVFAGGISTFSPRIQRLIAVGLILTSADAARRSWGLPILPYISALSGSFSGWRDIRHDTMMITSNPVWDSLVRSAEGRGIVVDHTADHALITMRGGRAIPLFSPILAPTFQRNVHFEEEVARLRSAGVRFITFSQQNPLSAPNHGHPFWSELYLHHGAVAQVNALIIYDLDHLPEVK